jgi:hypothetical protein
LLSLIPLSDRGARRRALGAAVFNAVKRKINQMENRR